MPKSTLLLLCVALTTAIAPFAPLLADPQTPPPQPLPAASSAAQPQPDGGAPKYIKEETPEQRRLRVGAVDPGPNPDQSTLFYRYAVPFHITRFDRQWAAFDTGDATSVRPFAFANFAYEIYQLNEKYVWVWVPEMLPQPATSPAAPSKPSATGLTKPQIDYLRRLRDEFTNRDVPQSGQTVRFEEASTGLPTAGSWRNGFTFADMNGDGKLDLVAPPQRAGDGLPSIFLGDGKGHWTPWADAAWPYRLDYGSVVAADFNGDGKMDLAFSVHLQGLRVLLGDGKGKFVDASHGLPISSFPTRRLVVADMDGDGAPDLVAISEGPGGGREITSANQVEGKVRVFLNRDHGKRWDAVNGSDPSRVLGGDYLAVGNFNGDRYPDFVGASIYFGAFDLVYLSKGKLKWVPPYPDGDIVPYHSYYYALATGHFTSKKHDDAVMSYVRFWPARVAADAGIEPPKYSSVAGVDLITFGGTKAKRTPIMTYSSASQISGMVAADFNHDGKLDLLFTRYDPREVVLLLGDGKGGFTRAQIDGLRLENNLNYDLIVGDVNGDGLPDVAIMYEANETTRLGPQNGSIHVFLNRGVAKTPPSTGRSK
jgi:FG-GAP-like repeat